MNHFGSLRPEFLGSPLEVVYVDRSSHFVPWMAEGFDVSACGRHPAKASRRTREKNSGTQVSHFGSVGPKCPFPCSQEVNDQTRGGLRWVCVTGLYLSIGHVEFSKFLTEIFVSCG